MKKTLKTQTKIAATLVCMGLLTLTVQAQNLFTDPGFELGTTAPNPNPNGVPGWANFGGAQFSTTYAHSGSSSLYTPDNGGGYSVPGTYQDFAATAGQTFTLSGWVYTPNVLPTLGNDFAIFQLSFFTGAPPNNYAVGADGPAVGVNIGQPAGGGGVPLPQGVWTFASVSAMAPAGANSMGAYILDINADANADFYFDDMSLTASPVPEPATLSLCALGIAGLAGFRFRRKV
jgi:hypothetical protein